MNSLLVRVGVDSSRGGGFWNAPADGETKEFAYVAIPETKAVHVGVEKPYSALEPVLSKFGVALPTHLRTLYMHLDPDFDHLTYGDQGQRAKQLRGKLGRGDMIVFYSGLANVRGASRLIYAITGLFVVDEIIPATSIPITARDTNAHTRRILAEDSQDLIVCARPGVSGRLERCLSIGEWRDGAYRVRRDVLEAWGGLSVKDGYLQRSARLPEFLNPRRFRRWFESQEPTLLQANN
jgi:Nucleotide modification associated domain 3